MAIMYAVNGHEFNIDDLTLGETAELERELGVVWGLINPLLHMEHGLAVLVKFAARDMGVDEARATMSALTRTQFIEMVRYDAEDEELPKDPAPSPTLPAPTTT